MVGVISHIFVIKFPIIYKILLVPMFDINIFSDVTAPVHAIVLGTAYSQLCGKILCGKICIYNLVPQQATIAIYCSWLTMLLFGLSKQFGYFIFFMDLLRQLQYYFMKTIYYMHAIFNYASWFEDNTLYYFCRSSKRR